MEAVGGEHQGQVTDVRKVALASMVGNATEWYDYFIFGTASALVFGQLFFPTSDPAIGTLLAFATFGVTFLVRPLGALIFGHFGDRLGRKAMLVFSILIMGVGTFCIGLLPTYESIGIWAPILLVLLRLFQGFAVGGEYGGAITMTMEFAPANRRGFYTALVAAGLSIGLLLATSVFYSFTLLPEEQFLAWGWRIPFLLSAVLVALGLYIRLRLSESPVFRRAQERAREQAQEARAPLGDILRHYKKIMILVILIATAVNVSFYIASAWSISYMTTEVGVSTATALTAVMIAAAVDFFAQLFFGALSDRFGRRPVYVGGSVAIGLAAFPFFWLINTGSAVWIFVAMILLISVGHGATYGVQAVFFSELFGTGVRYSGLSLGYHIGAALTSGPGPFVAAGLLAWTGGTWGISLLILLAAVVSVISTLLASETYARDIEEDDLVVSSRTPPETA